MITFDNFCIIPINEGQDINYVETHTGSIITAKIRAQEIALALQPLLYQGQISCAVENNSGDRIAYYDASTKKWIKVTK